MKILILPLLFFSVAVCAQKKEKEQPNPETDSLIAKLADTINYKKNLTEYKILVSKPENPSMYSSLKAKETDSTDYKILNSFERRKHKKED